MRRFVALVLAAALVSSSSSAASLHVHEYLGHDHPEHQHGLAVHDHTVPVAIELDHHGGADDDDHPSLDAASCDAARHAVNLRSAVAGVPHIQVDVAELPGPSFGNPASPVRSASPITDIRVHGPPFLRHRLARAPPVSLPA